MILTLIVIALCIYLINSTKRLNFIQNVVLFILFGALVSLPDIVPGIFENPLGIIAYFGLSLFIGINLRTLLSPFGPVPDVEEKQESDDD